MTDKSLLTSHKKSYDDEIGRGSGSTTTAPPMANAPAKSIYRWVRFEMKMCSMGNDNK